MLEMGLEGEGGDCFGEGEFFLAFLFLARVSASSIVLLSHLRPAMSRPDLCHQAEPEQGCVGHSGIQNAWIPFCFHKRCRIQCLIRH